MKITVVIPAKEEVGSIAKVVEAAKKYADRVIVIDGHSGDGTVEAAKSAGVEVFPDNGRGKGDGYKVGMAAAGLEGIIVFMDADGSHEPADIPKLAAPIANNEADLVIATRLKAGSDDIQVSLSSFIRDVGGNLLTLLIAWRFKSQLTDALNGFRAMRADLGPWFIEHLRADDFDVEHEMIMKALKRGLRVTEVASHEYARQSGVSKLPTYRKFYIFFWRYFLNFF